MLWDLNNLAISRIIWRKPGPWFAFFYTAIRAKLVRNLIGHIVPIEIYYVFCIHPRTWPVISNLAFSINENLRLRRGRKAASIVLCHPKQHIHNTVLTIAMHLNLLLTYILRIDQKLRSEQKAFLSYYKTLPNSSIGIWTNPSDQKHWLSMPFCFLLVHYREGNCASFLLWPVTQMMALLLSWREL